MLNKKKIIFPAAYFCSWNGGTKLIKMCLDSILYFDKKKKFEYILLLPDKNILSYSKRFYFVSKNIVKNILAFNLKYIDWPYHNNAKELRNFFSKRKNLKIVGVDYRNEKKYLNDKKNINFLSMDINSNNQKIGYIFDFQHKYLNNLFSSNQIADRDNFFKKIIENNNQIIVNSKQTKKDIFKFYNKVHTKVEVLPFLPFMDFDVGSIDKRIFKEDYFVICNQFWKHKNFETAIQAFKNLRKFSFKLVITGQLNSKNKKYFNEILNLIRKNQLEKNIILMNNLEKKVQLNLIKYSVALIQPSLFEGGPGGFSVYEAISLGKPVIVSGIKVNREIKYNKKFFFKTKDHNDLKKKIIYVYKKKYKTISINILKKKSNRNKFMFGKFLYNVISKIN